MSAPDDNGFNLLSHIGVAKSDAIAFVDSEGRSLSYSDLHQNTGELRSQILEQTSGQIVRCVTVLPNHPTTVILQLALLGNCTLVPANPSSSERELDELIASVGADCIISRSNNVVCATLASRHGLTQIDFDAEAGSFDSSIRQFPGSNLQIASNRAAPETEASTALILPTSGSTGSPKLVPLQISALAQSAANIAEHLQLSEADRALHILPMFHIGAIVDLVLAPLIAGGSVCFAHGLAFNQLASFIRKHQVSWMQLVPTMLTRLLAESAESELEALGQQLRFIRSVSSDLPPAIQTEAETRLAGVPIIQIYGLTETSGQVASNPLPPEERRLGTVGKACGAEICIMDAFANALEAGEEGEICVRGASVMLGYENFDNAQAFFGSWLRTGDLGKFDADGYLCISGRLKEVVNRGGEKIALQEIDRVAIAHDGIIDAASFAIPHPSLGEEVAIALVSSNVRLTEEDMAQYFCRHLSEHKRPRQIYLLKQLPKLGSGKIDRSSLSNLSTSNRVESKHINYRPESLNERLVSRLWAKILRVKQPVPGDDFFDAGGDSLAATAFLASLEKATQKSFPSDLLYRSPKYETLVEAIEKVESKTKGDYGLGLPKPIFDAVRRATAAWPGRRRRSDSLIIEHNTTGIKQAFFWCGNGRDNFEEIVQAFGPDRPIYVLRTLSGLKHKSDVNTALLAAHYVLEIEQIEPEAPICLGGVCQGAVLARQIAQQLADRGREIKLTVFVDRIFTQPFEFPTLLVWSGSSQHSSRVAYLNPERGLPYLYPAGAESIRHSGPHSALVSGNGAAELVERIESYLDSGLVPDIGAERDCFFERRQLYEADLTARMPRFVSADEEMTIAVEVKNTSSGNWMSTDKGGFYLASRWLNLDGHIRTVMAGAAELQNDLAVGESCLLELKLRVPKKKLPYILLLDMVDDGVTWFHQQETNKNHRPLKKLVVCLS